MTDARETAWQRLHCPACGRFRGRMALPLRALTLELAPCPGCGQVARVTVAEGGAATVAVAPPTPRRPGERGPTDPRPGER
jgi:hypothetical protein